MSCTNAPLSNTDTEEPHYGAHSCLHPLSLTSRLACDRSCRHNQSVNLLKSQATADCLCFYLSAQNPVCCVRKCCAIPKLAYAAYSGRYTCNVSRNRTTHCQFILIWVHFSVDTFPGVATRVTGVHTQLNQVDADQPFWTENEAKSEGK